MAMWCHNQFIFFHEHAKTLHVNILLLDQYTTVTRGGSNMP